MSIFVPGWLIFQRHGTQSGWTAAMFCAENEWKNEVCGYKCTIVSFVKTATVQNVSQSKNDFNINSFTWKTRMEVIQTNSVLEFLRKIK
jgi:hypothetical protein